jgi:hypothetical protein
MDNLEHIADDFRPVIRRRLATIGATSASAASRALIKRALVPRIECPEWTFADTRSCRDRKSGRFASTLRSIVRTSANSREVAMRHNENVGFSF